MTRIPPGDNPPRKGWVVKISPDVDLKPIRPSHFKMAAILERLLRANAEAWPTNRTLADRYGCSKGQVQKILRGMQAEGFITRAPIDPEDPRAGRTGILANRRLDLDLPVAAKPPSAEDIGRLKRRRGGIKNDAPGVSKMMPPGGIKNDAPSNKESLSLKEDEPEGPGGSLDQRQRKDSPIRTSDPDVPTPEVPAAAAAPAAALTPGQLGFLARLDADRRATFDALSPGKQSALLKPHGPGFLADIADFQIRAELGTVRPIEDVPPIPATMSELLEQLPGKPRSWTPKAAEALAQDFGGKKDRALWGEFARIAEAVRLGNLDPAPVVAAHRQAMAPGIERRGAKFWAALKALAELEPSDLAELAAPR